MSIDMSIPGRCWQYWHILLGTSKQDTSIMDFPIMIESTCVRRHGDMIPYYNLKISQFPKYQ